MLLWWTMSATINAQTVANLASSCSNICASPAILNPMIAPCKLASISKLIHQSTTRILLQRLIAKAIPITDYAQESGPKP